MYIVDNLSKSYYYMFVEVCFDRIFTLLSFINRLPFVYRHDNKKFTQIAILTRLS